MPDALPIAKTYASCSQPVIKAILKTLYRFANTQQALDCLTQLRKNFIISHRFTVVTEHNEVILWIRGYGITEREAAEGYSGHFARITIRSEGTKFTLEAVKQPAELALHPQRKRPKREHPDWGHPILRQVKKGRVYDSFEEAVHALRLLHETYPAISIPDEKHLFIIIYEKAADRTTPVQKYKLEIKVHPKGGFFIDAQSRVKFKQSALTKPADTVDGYFTSMVTLRRKKRKRPIIPQPKSPLS